jgi:hypothetical protein
MSTSQQVPTETLVKAYLKLRRTIEEKEAVHKEELAPLKEKYAAVADALMAVCNKENASSINTPSGTVIRKISYRYWPTDWDDFRKFVSDNDVFDLLEKRVHNANMRKFLEENPNNAPSGLQCDTKYTVQVNKPRNS